MSAIHYLLDTNIVIGRLKTSPPVMALVKQLGFDFDNSAISQITRIELLSFPGWSLKRKIKSMPSLIIALFIPAYVKDTSGKSGSSTLPEKVTSDFMPSYPFSVT